MGEKEGGRGREGGWRQVAGVDDNRTHTHGHEWTINHNYAQGWSKGGRERMQ